MNDVQFSLGILDAILTEAQRDDTSFSERAGLWAAAKSQGQGFLVHINDAHGSDGNMREKVHNYLWHVGAALGFDVTNGKPKSQHLSWAAGELDSLKGLLRR